MENVDFNGFLGSNNGLASINNLLLNYGMIIYQEVGIA